MAMALEDCCPICLGSWEDMSYVMPCLHLFCYPCILQWAETKPECPLCKGRIQSILHSVRADDDYVEHVITPSEASSATVHQVRRAARRPPTRDFQRRAAEVVPTGSMVSFWIPNWLRFLPHELMRFLTLWSSRSGGDVRHSRETNHRLDRQGTRAAREQEGTQEGHLTPSPATSSSLSRSTRDELPSTSSAAPLVDVPAATPLLPVPPLWSKKSPSSSQRRPRGPSAPSRHCQHSTGRGRRPPKRKTSSHETPLAKKRPPPRL